MSKRQQLISYLKSGSFTLDECVKGTGLSRALVGVYLANLGSGNPYPGFVKTGEKYHYRYSIAASGAQAAVAAPEKADANAQTV